MWTGTQGGHGGRPAAKEPKEGVEGLDVSMLMVVPAK